MGAKSPKKLARTLQQLAQMFSERQVLNEIDRQIDSFVRENNIRSGEFQERAQALDTETYKTASLPLYRYTRLIQDYSDLNEELEVVRRGIKARYTGMVLHKIETVMWPLVLKITCRHAELTGTPGNSIDALTTLYVTLGRLCNIRTSSHSEGDNLKKSTNQAQTNSIQVIVVKDNPKEES